MKPRVGVLLLVLLFAGALAQGVNPIRTTVETFIVSVATQPNGTRVEQLTATAMGEPGQTVEYQVRVMNASVSVVPAGVVVVTLPILPGTRYLNLSATRASETLITEFTADTEPLADMAAYSDQNVFVVIDGVRSIAEPEAYTGIRWTLLQPLDPGEGVTLKYRVVILAD